jgi:hypothetical protein
MKKILLIPLLFITSLIYAQSLNDINDYVDSILTTGNGLSLRSNSYRPLPYDDLNEAFKKITQYVQDSTGSSLTGGDGIYIQGDSANLGGAITTPTTLILGASAPYFNIVSAVNGNTVSFGPQVGYFAVSSSTPFNDALLITPATLQLNLNDGGASMILNGLGGGSYTFGVLNNGHTMGGGVSPYYEIQMNDISSYLSGNAGNEYWDLTIGNADLFISGASNPYIDLYMQQAGLFINGTTGNEYVDIEADNSSVYFQGGSTPFFAFEAGGPSNSSMYVSGENNAELMNLDVGDGEIYMQGYGDPYLDIRGVEVNIDDVVSYIGFHFQDSVGTVNSINNKLPSVGWVYDYVEDSVIDKIEALEYEEQASLSVNIAFDKNYITADTLVQSSTITFSETGTTYRGRTNSFYFLANGNSINFAHGSTKTWMLIGVTHGSGLINGQLYSVLMTYIDDSPTEVLEAKFTPVTDSP